MIEKERLSEPIEFDIEGAYGILYPMGFDKERAYSIYDLAECVADAERDSEERRECWEMLTKISKTLAMYEKLDSTDRLFLAEANIGDPCYFINECKCNKTYRCQAHILKEKVGTKKRNIKTDKIVRRKDVPNSPYKRCFKITKTTLRREWMDKIGVKAFLDIDEAIKRCKKIDETSFHRQTTIWSDKKCRERKTLNWEMFCQMYGYDTDWMSHIGVAKWDGEVL